MSNLQYLPPDFEERCAAYRVALERGYVNGSLDDAGRSQLEQERVQIKLRAEDASEIEDAYLRENALLLLERRMQTQINAAQKRIAEQEQLLSEALRLPPALIVSQQGDGHYRTIGEAINSALPGARLLIRQGTYNESLVIDKMLSIIGDRPVDEIIIESTDAPCILMQANDAIVRGLTLRGRAGQEENKAPAVRIKTGRLLLEECDITSDSRRSCIIYKSTANPIIRRCRIHGGAAGVLIGKGSRGIVEDCDIFGNKIAAVVIQGSDPIIRRCRIHDGKGGVAIVKEGKGTIYDCDIFGNKGSGILIQDNSNPVIQRCRIHDGQDAGIKVTESEGMVEECDIYDNKGSGVSIEKNSNPLIWRCRVHDGEKAGISVTQSEGAVGDCDIYRNTGLGIEISENSQPTIQWCRIYDGEKAGLLVTESKGTISDCDIFDNTGSGVSIEKKSHPVIRRCRIHNQKKMGVFIKESEGIVEDCDIFGNKNSGVLIQKDGKSVIRRCRIHNGQSKGISVYGRGRVDNCDIFGNTQAGVKIWGNPIIRQCKIHDQSKDNGVIIMPGGQGKLENCDIFGNALAGVRIEKDSQPVIRECRINRNWGEGIYICANAAGSVEGNDLTDNIDGSYHAEGTHSVVGVRNQMDEGQSDGIDDLRAQRDVALTLQATEYGPANDKLAHREGNSIDLQKAGVALGNFMVEVAFYNPYDHSERAWDYGFGFRSTSGNENYRLYVEYDGDWHLVLVAMQDGQSEFNYIAKGKVNNLDVSHNGLNHLRLVVKDDLGFFFVNREYIAKLDVSEKKLSGDIWVGTGFTKGHRIEGKSTRYEGFTVWPLP